MEVKLLNIIVLGIDLEMISAEIDVPKHDRNARAICAQVTTQAAQSTFITGTPVESNECSKPSKNCTIHMNFLRNHKPIVEC